MINSSYDQILVAFFKAKLGDHSNYSKVILCILSNISTSMEKNTATESEVKLLQVIMSAIQTMPFDGIKIKTLLKLGPKYTEEDKNLMDKLGIYFLENNSRYYPDVTVELDSEVTVSQSFKDLILKGLS